MQDERRRGNYGCCLGRCDCEAVRKPIFLENSWFFLERLGAGGGWRRSQPLSVCRGGTCGLASKEQKVAEWLPR